MAWERAGWPGDSALGLLDHLEASDSGAGPWTGGPDQSAQGHLVIVRVRRERRRRERRRRGRHRRERHRRGRCYCRYERRRRGRRHFYADTVVVDVIVVTDDFVTGTSLTCVTAECHAGCVAVISIQYRYADARGLVARQICDRRNRPQQPLQH